MGVSSGSTSSQWRTPLPYLFGGLAAMFFLISMSLLFLVCSYVRHTNRLERDVEAGRRRDSSERGGGAGVVKVAKEKFAVIMPGDENPTCLATPRCYRVLFDSVKVASDDKSQSNDDQVMVMEKSISSGTIE